jgi:putative NADH-flavin reductase
LEGVKRKRRTSMRVTIFGASGKVGTLLVDQALQAGHAVTAVVRDPARLQPPAHGTPQVITADVTSPNAIAPAVDGADAVISVVGPKGRGPTTILADSTRSIVTAMEGCGAKRLMILSGSMVDDTGDGPFLRYVGKPVGRRLLKEVCTDMVRAEDEVHASHLDWTIFRPPNLADGPARGGYRTALDRNVRRGYRVRRADLATCMLESIDDPRTVHRHVFLAS